MMKTKSSQQRSMLIRFILLVLSAGLAEAQIQDRPRLRPEHKKMEMFVGTWNYDGAVNETALGPGGKFSGRMTSQMVLDGLFLERKAEDRGLYAGKAVIFRNIQIMWYDPAQKAYTEQTFDNDGMVSKVNTTVDGNTWTDTGITTESKGKVYKTRTTNTFSADGKTFKSRTELSMDDGKTWILRWEFTARKVKG